MKRPFAGGITGMARAQRKVTRHAPECFSSGSPRLDCTDNTCHVIGYRLPSPLPESKVIFG